MKVKLSEDLGEFRAVIKVIGVGGAGGNAVNRMAEAHLQGVELIAANSDAQALRANQAHIKLQLGETLTRGLGVGGDAAKGQRAALESESEIREILKGSDLVFITVGMGGGTGTGGGPVVAKLAKEMEILTIGVVTRPFRFEGLARAQIAEQGISDMRDSVDALLIIPNEKLFEIIDKDTSSETAFRQADDVLRKAIQSISDVITASGVINMDLNDLRAIMKDAGDALIGMAEESGEGRAVRAARAAVESPLLENVMIDGAKGLIINVTGRKDTLKLSEIDEVMAVITGRASPDAKIKLGKAYDDSLGDSLRITVIATGFPVRRGIKRELRSGFRPVLPGGPMPGLDAAVALDSRALAPGEAPEEWAKPAFLRIKTKKLRI